MPNRMMLLSEVIKERMTHLPIPNAYVQMSTTPSLSSYAILVHDPLGVEEEGEVVTQQLKPLGH